MNITKGLKGFYQHFFLCFEILYLEIFFRFSVKNIWSFKIMVYSLLFSIGIGMFLEFLLGFIPKKIPYMIFRSLFSILLSLPYMVNYFIHCKFHVFYDVNTIFAGASDAAGEFSLDIRQLVFSMNGVSHILLFLFPFMVSVVIGMLAEKLSIRSSHEMSLRNRIRFLSVCITLLLCLFLGIHFEPDFNKTMYQDYQYENAIEQFGVMTAMVLDIRSDKIILEDELDFETEDFSLQEANDEYTVTAFAELDSNEDLSVSNNQTNSVSKPENTLRDTITENIEQEEMEYTPNMLPINFNELANGASKELASLDTYVAGVAPSMKNQYTGLFRGKNLIFITAEAFTTEVINEKLTPTLYRMANKGIQITDYYQPSSAGTTGGEYANIMAMLPTAGGKSMKMTADHLNYMTIGNLLNMEGYYGMAYHNNSYTYYDRHLTHVNLGYSNGYMGKGNGMEEYLSSVWPESDLEMMQGTLPTYIDHEPFNIYYMSVSGHSLYTFKENAMARKHRDEVANLPYSDSVKAYYACQLELESAMSYLVNELENAGKADDTVIVISADHFPYGLDVGDSLTNLTEWYGTEITNNLYRDHNRLIIWSGCLEKMDPIVVDSPTFSPDILPTLCNLFGIEYDSRLLIGRDILSTTPALIFDLGYNWKTDLGTYVKGKFTPVNDEIEIPKDYVKDINKIVKNKITYSKGVLNYDYYRHVFGTN